jgi:hypothetical protein
LHIRPERCVEEDEPGVPIVALPPGRGCAGDGPADGGPLLLGVMISLGSSSPSCLFELAILPWLLLMSAIYVFEVDLKLLAYIGVPEVVESMVLVRLPLTAGRDIEPKGLGVSGGENGFAEGFSKDGDAGVLGKGFSRLRLLVLRSCFFLSVLGDLSVPAEAGIDSGDAAVDASPT